ncbi:MAG: freyrasin family ranthipeptide [Romboutsia sp.]|nr:freyrasin family ranthipeptide [Romboutsia sp.]
MLERANKSSRSDVKMYSCEHTDHCYFCDKGDYCSSCDAADFCIFSDT